MARDNIEPPYDPDTIEHFDGEFGDEVRKPELDITSIETLDRGHFTLAYEEYCKQRDELFKDPGNPVNRFNVLDGGFVKDDKGKMKLELTPPEIEEIFTSVLEAGLKKGYPKDSWTKKGATEEMFLAAARRHINRRRKGELIDPETGCSHLAHAGWQLMAAAYHELKGNFNDT